MDTKNKTKSLDGITLAKAIKLMFKDMKSGHTVYLAFSRKSFHILIFTIAMSIIANIALVDLLVSAPTVVERTNTVMFVTQTILSVVAIVSGLWLFLKGVNIVIDK